MKFKKALSGVTSLLYVILLISSILLSGSVVLQKINGVQTPMVFGWGVARVLTGSMEPAIPVGSMIVIQEQDGYGVADVVTYENGQGRSVTHRIISVRGNEIVAQGDANNAADAPFKEDQIIGKVRLIIPEGGKIVIAATAVILIVCLTFSLLRNCPQCGKRGNESEVKVWRKKQVN